MAQVVSCPICYENFKTSDDVYSTSCGHVYHYACMQQWRSRYSSCPQCRTHNPSDHKVYFAFESDSEANKKLEESKKNMDVASGNLKQMETNISEMQLELDEKNRIILILKNKLEPLVTANSLLESKLEESEDRNIKLNSQLDESLFNGSRIEQELDLYKKEICQVATGDTSNNNGEIFHLKMQVKLLQSEAKIKDEKIHNLYLEKCKLEKALKLAQKNTSQLKVQEDQIKALNTKLKEAQNKKKKTPKNAKPEQATNASNLFEAIEAALTLETQDDLSAGKEINNIKNAVVVKNITFQLDESNYKLLIVKLAALMGLVITDSDVVNVKLMANKKVINNPGSNAKITLCAEFKEHSQKVSFLASKAKLRARPETKDMIIYEYNEDKVLSLYHFASVLRNFGFKVYCRNNEVFTSKNGRVTKIYCSQQVHSLLRSERGISALSTAASTLDLSSPIPFPF